MPPTASSSGVLGGNVVVAELTAAKRQLAPLERCERGGLSGFGGLPRLAVGRAAAAEEGHPR
jgi:hypothetical protein